MKDYDIVEMSKKTAEQLSLLVVKMAERIVELETENAVLKQKLEVHNDDLK